MIATIKHKLEHNKVVNVLLAVVLVLGLAPITALSQADKAYAAGSASLSVGGNINYAGYFTTWFSADGNMAYCGNPSKATPPAGNYTKHNINSISGRDSETEADLWFGFGSPGFDASLWPSKWYDGSSMTDERYAALTHILLSDTFASDGYYALFGCNAQFASWARENVIGFDTNGNEINTSATGRRIVRMQNQVPDSFHAFQLNTGGASQLILSFTYTPYGAIDLQKASGNTAITDGNGCYTLAGAEYGVYRDAGCTDYWFSMKTDAAGYWKTANDIPIGTYGVKEITPPKGYALDETHYKVEVKLDQTTRVNGGTVTDTPQNDPAAMWVGKIDLDTTQNLPQGSASFENAHFTVRYYDGQYTSVAAAEASGAPTRTWVVKTDADGFAQLGDKYKVSGDEFYRDSTGKITIPLGTVLIQETKAPEGYNLDGNTVFVRQITSAGIIENVETYNTPIQSEAVIRGGIKMPKIDRETDLNSPLGSASVDGAVFAIKNVSENAVQVDGKMVKPGQDACSITTVDGVASTATNALPYGKYELRETMPPTGYLPSNEVWAFEIVDNGKIVTPTLEQSIDDQVKRGDLEFLKTNEVDMSRLSNVPFVLTSETTGEHHIVVTDVNGHVNTESSWNAHSASTNINDTLAEGTYKPETGVWFGLAQNGTTAPVDDALGALPYDTYTLEELACTANKGLQLLKLTGITIARDKITVDLGTLDDPGSTELYITTTAWDGVDLDKITIADPEAKITDKVNYVNAAPNKIYTLKGELVFADTGEAVVIDGVAVTSEKTFTTTTGNGYVNMDFAFDATKLGGRDVVVFETLYQNGTVAAEHKELTDTEQTVKIVAPEIGTTALDGADGDKNVVADPETVVVDTVSYKNLIVDTVEYKLSGALMDKATGEALVIDGVPVVAETIFTPKTASGTVDVTFNFDGSALAGKEFVVFESLTRLDKELAIHADIEDAAQTVSVTSPEIGTTALDGVDGDKNVVADQDAVVIDTVAYENLVPSKRYKLSGALMDKATGEAFVIDGEAVVGEVEFIPETPNGTVDVTFAFDASMLAGGTELVAFESLSRLDKELAIHADIEDAAQMVTIVVPEIGTTATDSLDGDKNVVADPEAKITDEVAYENVLPGDDTYVMAGILMNKATGLPVLAGVGADKVDTKKLDEFVASLAKVLGFAPVADEPEKGDPSKPVEPNKDANETEQGTNTPAETPDKAPVLPVTVDFEALAKLMEQNADLLSLMSTATQEFTPEASSGTIDMEYAFDASTLAGTDTVVFEVLIKDTAVVAIHADLDDEGQTTSVVPSKIGTKASDKTDGDNELIASTTATIVDQIGYTDLLPGKEYEIKGVLMDKATGKPLMVKDQKVEASTIFTPNAPNGVIELEYTFDASALAGHELVVFETLYKDGIEIYAHADINDAAQTVKVVTPPIGTTYDKTGNNLASALVLVALLTLGGVGAVAYGVRQRKITDTPAEDADATGDDTE